MTIHRIERAVVDAIAWFYEFPPAALAPVCLGIIWVCYFILTPAIGIPIVLICGLMPWLEALLKRHLDRVARRGIERSPR
jgi:hypothetical protein